MNTPTLGFVVFSLAPIAFAQSASLADQPVPAPHPAITEILFHVPVGGEGDASLDGKRDAVGDEFIEIANLHDQPIDLAGYSLSDRGEQFKFTFPKLTLAPGEVVVLFNGYDTTIPGAVGGMKAPPASTNSNFHNAWVFTLGNSKRTIALNNQSDRVVLSSPDGLPIDIVSWGARDNRDYVSHPRMASVNASPKCSVQRVLDSGKLLPHLDIDGAPFSPGWIPQSVTVEKNNKQTKKKKST